jgi:methyl-accepting chemotaxis protein
MSLRNVRISRKLYAVVAIACLGLAAISGAAVIGAHRMAAAGQSLYADALPGVELGSRLAMLFEQARGAVARAPAEMDLARQGEYQKSFAADVEAVRAGLAALEQGADATTLPLVAALRDDLALLEAAAGKVFEYAGSFAQDQAVGVLNGDYAAVDARIVAGTDKVLAAKRRFAAEAASTLSHAHRLLLIVIGAAAGAAGLLILGVSFVLVRHVTSRIGRLGGTMLALSKNDLSVEVQGANDSDEIGRMAGTVLIFRQSMIQGREMAEREAQAVRQREARAAAIERLTRDFEHSVGTALATASSAAERMQDTATTLSGAVERSSQQAQAVAAAAEVASTNVQAVAGAASQLAGSVGEISREMAQTTSVAGRAVDEAAKTNARVQQLSESAQKIGDVVQLISDIAGQTNLLALNATIEAARAGEAGKGFAVVASEVKTLANQTAAATDDIAAQVGAIREATKGAVAAIQEIGSTIESLNEISATIAAAVEEQGAATRDMALNIEQAAQGTKEVSTNIVGVSDAAAESDEVSRQVFATSQELAGLSKSLHAEIDRFLAAVKAA